MPTTPSPRRYTPSMRQTRSHKIPLANDYVYDDLYYETGSIMCGPVDSSPVLDDYYFLDHHLVQGGSAKQDIRGQQQRQQQKQVSSMDRPHSDMSPSIYPNRSIQTNSPKICRNEPSTHTISSPATGNYHHHSKVRESTQEKSRSRSRSPLPPSAPPPSLSMPVSARRSNYQPPPAYNPDVCNSVTCDSIKDDRSIKMKSSVVDDCISDISDQYDEIDDKYRSPHYFRDDERNISQVSDYHEHNKNQEYVYKSTPRSPMFVHSADRHPKSHDKYPSEYATPRRYDRNPLRNDSHMNNGNSTPKTVPSLIERQRIFKNQQTPQAPNHTRACRVYDETDGAIQLQQEAIAEASEKKLDEILTKHRKEEVDNEENDMNALNNLSKKRSPNASVSLVNIKEKIFGDSPTKRTGHQGFLGHLPPRSIEARSLMKYTVLESNGGTWVVTVSTNQLSSTDPNQKCMKAFSCNSEDEAKATGEAYAPPKMNIKRDDSNSRCTICLAKFAVLRRSHNCRNCGSCICSTCSITWPSKMIPDTYNFKQESSVRICTSCEWLKESFRRALLDGKFDEVLSLYQIGNINLRCPFANNKGEIMYPVHCAVASGNLDLIKWLVDTKYCPLKTSISKNDLASPKIPLTTSKGKNVIDIAMKGQHVDVIRYLVVEKAFSVFETKNTYILQLVLDAALRSIPTDYVIPKSKANSRSILINNNGDSNDLSESSGGIPGNDISSKVINKDALDRTRQNEKDNLLATPMNSDEACLLCKRNEINCVFTPCGHMCCCISCGERIMSCPLCGDRCYSIKTYKNGSRNVIVTK